MSNEAAEPNLLDLATELTIAWLSNPNTRASADEVPGFLEKMHGAVKTLAAPAQQPGESQAEPQYTAAVTVRRSLASKDHIISMIDGKPYKTLKRHLSTHGLTPQQYRERYGLRPDYPMVAENYAEMRRGLAKKIGLGRKPGAKAPSKGNAAPQAEAAPYAEAAPKAKAAPKTQAAPKAQASAKVQVAPKPDAAPKPRARKKATDAAKPATAT
jgi:predicted transcriptional regulator